MIASTLIGSCSPTAGQFLPSRRFRTRDHGHVSEPIELVGNQVRLRSTVAEDAPALIAIRKTDRVRAWWRGVDFEAEFAEDLSDEGVHQLTITAEEHIIGMIQFSEEHDPDYRHASLDIYIDPAVHRRGHASDAIRTLADHLFDQRGHHRLTIDPSVANRAAIGCYTSIGFQPVGVMRAYERRADGTWANGLFMEMLASDRTRFRRTPSTRR